MKTGRPPVHGEARHGKQSTEWNAWSSMRKRCLCQSHHAFAHYGGRGITVDPRWESFEAFLEDMGRKPDESFSLDRIDNEKGYAPENCRWADKSSQSRNRSTTKWHTIDGKRMCEAEICKVYGVPSTTLRRRIAKGIPVTEAIRTNRP